MAKYAVLHGLEPGVQYAVQVRAKGEKIDGYTDSPWSDVFIYTTGSDTTAPDAPTGGAFASAYGGVFASWTPPASVLDFRDYQVTFYDSGTPSASGIAYTDADSITLSAEQIQSDIGGASNVTLEVKSRDTSGNLSSALSITGAVTPLDTFDETAHDSHDHSTALGTASIDDLSDVDTTSSPPVTGNALLWDGANWAPGTASTVAELNDLTDVNAAAPSDGQALVYQSSTDTWIPGSVASGGGGGGAGTYTYVGTHGDGSSTGITVNHGLGTTDVGVHLIDLAENPDVMVATEIQIIDQDNIKLIFDTAPATDTIRVVVLGAGGVQPTFFYTEVFGNGSATGFDITHDFETTDVMVQVRENVTGGEIVFPTISITDANTVRLEFTSAPASNSHKVIVTSFTDVASIDTMGDVSTSGAVTNDVLQYNGTTWQATAPPWATIGLVIALS